MIGDPISTAGVDIEDRDSVKALHEHVMSTVQDLLEYAQVQRELKS